MQEIRLFQEEGRQVLVEGNKPLLLTNPLKAYLVEEGNITVFLTQLNNSEAVGRRYFLFEAKKGDLLFGINPLNNEKGDYGLLVSGLVSTSLLELEKPKILLVEHDLEQKKILLKKLSEWIRNLGKGLERSKSLEVGFPSDEDNPANIIVQIDDKQMGLEDYQNYFLQEVTEKTLQTIQLEKNNSKKRSKMILSLWTIP